MKSKVVQYLLVAFIVLMLGGIIGSIKEPSNDVSEIISNFENESEYEVNGYASNDIFNEDNTNIIGELNGKIGNGISKVVNGGIDFLFDLFKKLIS